MADAPDATMPPDNNRPKFIQAPKPPTESTVRNKFWPYPKPLYHDGGSYRVVWSREEHMEAKAEGWADTPTVGVEYVPWTAEEPATKADPNQLRKIASCVVTPGTIRRNRGSDPKVQRIKNQVRNLRKEGLDYKSICDRLGDSDRPRRAAWRHLSWPIAYKRHTSAVTKWLSEACRDLPSVTI
jgi:hypothetical protein